MGWYVDVSTPVDDCYECNLALFEIISFIGEKRKFIKKSRFLSAKDDYVVGLNYVNQKCGYLHKHAINKLVNSEKRETYLHDEYRRWRFHKTKAKKLFRKLAQILDDLDANDEIWKKFDKVYHHILNDFAVDRNGSYIIAYPYKTSLNQIIAGRDYSKNERTCIENVMSTFKKYDDYYGGIEKEVKGKQ